MKDSIEKKTGICWNKEDDGRGQSAKIRGQKMAAEAKNNKGRESMRGGGGDVEH
jgi:hypothetical protein